MRKRPNDVEKLDRISQSVNVDGEGNLTASKNLGVDGKLTLKSLVSASNPDGDIIKELGSGKLYRHNITIYSNQTYGYVDATVFASTDKEFTKQSFSLYLDNGSTMASGLFKYKGEYATVLNISALGSSLSLTLFAPSVNATTNRNITDGTYVFRDRVKPVK